MYLWWSLCTLYLRACQVRVTAGESGLYSCVCVTSCEPLVEFMYLVFIYSHAR